MEMAHPGQRGFLRGRKMLNHDLDTQLALEEAEFLGLEPRAVALFDVLRRGIKQGCPAGGALWSLLFDPIVRRLVSSLARCRFALPTTLRRLWATRW